MSTSQEFDKLQPGDEVRIIKGVVHNEYTSKFTPDRALEVVEARSYTVIATDGNKNYKIHHSDLLVISSFHQTQRNSVRKLEVPDNMPKFSYGIRDEVVCIDISERTRATKLLKLGTSYYIRHVTQNLLSLRGIDNIQCMSKRFVPLEYFKEHYDEDIFGDFVLKSTNKNNKEDKKMSDSTIQLSVFDVEIYDTSDLDAIGCTGLMVAAKDSGKARDKALIKYVNEYEVEDTEDLEIIVVEKFKVTKKCKKK